MEIKIEWKMWQKVVVDVPAIKNVLCHHGEF